MLRTPRLAVFVSAATLALALLSASASAQTFHIYGKVKKSGGGFALEKVNVPLSGSNLKQFDDEDVVIRGTNIGTTAKPVVKVASIRETEESFEIDGSARIGGFLEMEIESKTGVYYYLLLSFNRGFTPVDGLYPNLNLTGTVFVDVNNFLIISSGRLRKGYDVKVFVPPARDLIGKRIWVQPAIIQSNGAAAYINADTTKLKGSKT